MSQNGDLAMAISIGIYSIEGPDVGFMRGVACMYVGCWIYVYIYMYIHMRITDDPGTYYTGNWAARDLPGLYGVGLWGPSPVRTRKLVGKNAFGVILGRLLWGRAFGIQVAIFRTWQRSQNHTILTAFDRSGRRSRLALDATSVSTQIEAFFREDSQCLISR